MNGSKLIHDGREFCLRIAESIRNTTSASEAFASWLLPDVFNKESLGAMAESASTVIGAQRTYRHLAIVGYASEMSDQTAKRQWFEEGLKQLVGRNPKLGGQLADYCMDGVALMGIALGVKQLSDSEMAAEFKRWARSIAEHAEEAPSIEPWNLSLLWAACGDTGRIVSPEVAFALYGRRIGSSPSDGQADELLKELTSASRLEPERAMLLASGFDALTSNTASISLVRPTPQQVGDMLRNLPSAMRRWTWEDSPRTKKSNAIKWDIQNEYHVQNLLLLVLSSVFPDARDEQYCNSVGHIQPRTDVEIPSLRLVVEAKFVRRDKHPKDIIGEIAQDCGLYLAKGSPHEHILPFIWDDGAKVQHHGLVIRGLKALPGVIDAVVLARPGNMISRREARAVEGPEKESRTQKSPKRH